MKTCFFIGHREAGDSINPLLQEAIERHIVECGVDEFIVGHYGTFDRMAAATVRKLKTRYPHIRLTLLLPYHPASDQPPEASEFDGCLYPRGMESVPKRFCILRANQYMISNSDYLIAYVWQPASNARNLLEYAQRRERQGKLKIENLADTKNGPV